MFFFFGCDISNINIYLFYQSKKHRIEILKGMRSNYKNYIEKYLPFIIVKLLRKNFLSSGNKKKYPLRRK